MKLVKDFVDYRIVLYWADKENLKSVSPNFSSINDAKDWWKKKEFKTYTGYERRDSIHDRRTDADKRSRMEKQHTDKTLMPFGRRTTDIPVHVNIDISKEKIALLKL